MGLKISRENPADVALTYWVPKLHGYRYTHTLEAIRWDIDRI